MSKHSRDVRQDLVSAYDRMMKRAHDALEKGALRPLEHLIETAGQTAVELGELTREESDKVAHYLRRDLHDAAIYLKRTERELGDWLRFDIELVEERIADVFAKMVDHTRMELERLAEQASEQDWHAGEVVGPGTLRCSGCREEVHFRETTHIPPCPKCGATTFQREPD